MKKKFQVVYSSRGMNIDKTNSFNNTCKKINLSNIIHFYEKNNQNYPTTHERK